ncbi:alpha/beta hydrolase [Thalassotalea crassostreae]|uniref:alpha/beta hydrolase n=1 Tax=Thalassotalea crassostreae TaxID=1763536 RepID=UPI00083888A7|nr:alpha/beta hydrolase [Thalassotalea crassostreae]
MKSLLTLIFLCFSAALSAQEQVALWQERSIPNFISTQAKEVILKRDTLFIADVQTPTIAAFLPEKSKSNGMAVLILPGGGYKGVAYDLEGTEYAKWFNSQGFAAFVLKYRMPQAKSAQVSYKAPIQDAQRAIKYIRYNARRFNIDKDKIGVIGSSAGGHLASTLATHRRTEYYQAQDEIDTMSSNVNFAMLIYPVISMKKGITHNGSRRNLLGKTPSKDLIIQFSNELHVTKDSPATFIVHSTSDTAVSVKNSKLFYEALLTHNVNVTMHLFAIGNHGYGLGTNIDYAPNWRHLAEQWLETLYH